MKYFKEVGQEMSKVTWPGLKESNRFTWIIIFMIAFFALYFTLTDNGFAWLVNWFISL
ncbi:preprotein translocase subunit SecE [Aerococcaceae bacterium DSM 111176]|nr:preprotein translocase subunit SecE [Aerococcaceae bacterium DSM 111176]